LFSIISILKKCEIKNTDMIIKGFSSIKSYISDITMKAKK
jgi:hypothetical protein